MWDGERDTAGRDNRRPWDTGGQGLRKTKTQENGAQCQGEPRWGAKGPPQQQLYRTELVALVTAQGTCLERVKLV